MREGGDGDGGGGEGAGGVGIVYFTYLARARVATFKESRLSFPHAISIGISHRGILESALSL